MTRGPSDQLDSAGAPTQTPDLEFVQRILDTARIATQSTSTWLVLTTGEQYLDHDLATTSVAGRPMPMDWAHDAVAQGLGGDRIACSPSGHADHTTLSSLLGRSVESVLGTAIGPADAPVGWLCCTDPASDRLDEGTRRILSSLAAALGSALSRAGDAASVESTRERVGRALRGSELTTVLQPIVDIESGRAIGVEALSRFRSEPARPDLWFADAERVGLGTALELVAVRSALSQIHRLPDDLYLGVNVSPKVLLTDELKTLIESAPSDRVVIEVTEHAGVDDYDELGRSIDWFRARGCRIAIDDVGAGFSSFAHVLRLKPDVLKVDLSIIRGIDVDPARRGLARGIVSMARDIGASVVAEGIETEGELNTVLDVGIDAVQGYYLGRPGPLPLPESYPRPTSRILDENGAPVGEADLLGHITKSWLRASDVEMVARSFLGVVQARTGLQTSYLTVLDPVTNGLEHRYVNNTGAIELPEGLVVPWEDTLCIRARAAGIRWTADVPTDLPGSEAAEALNVSTFLSIPVTLPSGELAGTLCAASTEERFIGAATLDEIELMARLLGDRLGETA